MDRSPDDALRLLLEITWPKLRDAMVLTERLGAPWCSLSRPFVRWAGEQAIAHVGTMQTTVLIAGEPVRMGAIHAVCTHPGHRKRGHARALLEEGLAHLEASGCAMQMLFAVEPAMYEPFGFRVVEQSVLELEIRSGAQPPRVAARFLHHDDGDDMALLRALLAERVAPSSRFAVLEPWRLFMLDLALAMAAGVGPRLLHVPSLDAVIVYSLAGDILRVWDVVARRVPSLRAVLAAVPERYTCVALEFDPDVFADAGDARPFIRVPDDVLMVRGGDAAAGPWAVPPLWRW